MSAETVRRGSYSIPSGASTVTLTGLGLPFDPTGVKASVRKLSAGALNLLAWVYGVPTSDGFTVELSGTTDMEGYVLDWEAWSDVSVPIDNSDTLALTYSDLVDEVRRFLGYGSSMTADQTTEVDRCVQAGYRQFLYPPAGEGHEHGYEWSFIRPSTTLDTVADDGVMDLPADFGRIVGDLNFAPDIYQSPVVQVSEARIQALLQESTDTDIPRYFCTRFKQTSGDHGQRQEIVFWPIPNAAYTLTYRYEGFTGKLSDQNPTPLGGMRHAEVLTESCLAIAEQRSNDESGLHTEKFFRLLAASIAQDRRGGARFFGHMGAQENDVLARHGACRSTEVTYKGETW